MIFESPAVDVCSMRLLLLGLRLGGLIELRIGILVSSLLVGSLSLIRVRYDMTMYQPCNVVPCHARSRGNISVVFVVYNEEGGCWLSS